MVRRKLVTRAVPVLLVACVLGWGGVPRAGGATNPDRGVVTVTTKLAYQGGAAAGTGIVLTSTGIVVTNNHVIRGATTIRVGIPSKHRSYRASVLGYSITADVAVLKLANASGLPTATIGSSAKLVRGQAVTAVGNAGGTGVLTSSSGTITGLGKTITVSDDQGGTERLSGLIQTNAQLEPGDSGGPLVDQSGRVVGMDAAASSSLRFGSPSGEGYAIPITRVTSIANKVRAGHASSTTHVGGTAFVGVSAQSSSFQQADGTVVPAVLVGDVVRGSPADRAGIVTGDLIVSVDRRSVGSSAALVNLLLGKSPGDVVQLAWVDQSGARHTASVTLASGPPQ